MSSAGRACIFTMKHLCCDDNGVQWKATAGFNCFLANLPWNVLDCEVNADVLLYQVETSGELHMLGIIFVVCIRTYQSGYEFVYKTDVHHARLETFYIPRWHLNHVGAMSIRAIGGESCRPHLL